MEIVWSKEIDEVLSKGQSLGKIGIKNWALEKKLALETLNKFGKMQVPILGGDVYEIKDGNINYSNDNWYCDQMVGESSSDFTLRSIRKAKEYIENYPGDSTNEFLFVLVPEVKN